jgi:hypothetical protein
LVGHGIKSYNPKRRATLLMKRILGSTILVMLGVTGALSAAVPEVNGAGAVNALALLGGALLLVKTRRKK